MYLAKFFHRPPGNDDRELLLIPQSHCAGTNRPIVMGIALGDSGKEFLRTDYTTVARAIAAFRREADKLRKQGYVETVQTDHALRTLPANPAPKPDWQRSLDELLLALFAEDAKAQSRLIDSLSSGPAAEEPLYLWIAAYRTADTGGLDARRLLDQAQATRGALAERMRAGPPAYIWSLAPQYLDAGINDLICERHIACGDAKAGLEAAQRAYDVSPNQYRGGRIAWILCEHFPELQDEAFDKAYRHGEFGGYEAVTALPAYADYVRRQRMVPESAPGWHWSARKEPASETELQQVEQQLGANLPPDYRRFLAQNGRTELLIRVRDASKELCFFGPSELVEKRNNFFNYETHFEKSPEQAEAWSDNGHGVLVRNLVPVAEPADVSSCLLIHVGPGERFGWCYRWSHDDRGSLEAAQPTFDQALTSITTGIERRDENRLLFFEIFPIARNSGSIRTTAQALNPHARLRDETGRTSHAVGGIVAFRPPAPASTPMYLAKFFHRPPGNDDRELLLAFDSQEPILIGIRMREDGEEFLREEFSTGAAGVAAFRRAADELRAAGYIETAHTDYTLRNLLPDPAPKAPWQQALDELMLSALVDDLPTQAARIEALRQPPAAREPLYLWLAAHHRAASGGLLSGACPSRRTGSNFAGTCAENPQALALAEAARDAIASRKAGKVAFYAWSIRRHELEAMNFELLCRLHLAAGDAAAALAAIEQACDLAASTTRGGLRGSILCEFYPDRREEAFDDAFRYGEFGGYDAIMAHPDYADYVARRKNRKKRKSDKGWRWGEQKKPASEADLRQAEAQLGTALPPDYRAFLAKTGRSELMIRLAEESADLRFHGAGELMQQRGYLIDFITRTQRSSAEAESYFGQQYGVSLRDLVPIAEPSNLSRCILIHLGAGERFGWCYRWDHDGAWELEAAQPSFEAALRALTAGIERRDENALSFFEISPDREE